VLNSKHNRCGLSRIEHEGKDSCPRGVSMHFVPHLTLRTALTPLPLAFDDELDHGVRNEALENRLVAKAIAAAEAGRRYGDVAATLS
jgi:hypothetical protein